MSSRIAADDRAPATPSCVTWRRAAMLLSLSLFHVVSLAHGGVIGDSTQLPQTAVQSTGSPDFDSNEELASEAPPAAHPNTELAVGQQLLSDPQAPWQLHLAQSAGSSEISGRVDPLIQAVARLSTIQGAGDSKNSQPIPEEVDPSLGRKPAGAGTADSPTVNPAPSAPALSENRFEPLVIEPTGRLAGFPNDSCPAAHPMTRFRPPCRLASAVVG